MSWEIKKRFNDFEVSRQLSPSKQTIMDDYPPEGVFKTSKTAVEWLVHQVNSDCLNSTFIDPKLVETANKLFKDQIVDSFDAGYRDYASSWYETGKQYYNETYNK